MKVISIHIIYTYTKPNQKKTKIAKTTPIVFSFSRIQASAVKTDLK